MELNDAENKNEKLTSLNSPYSVQYSENVKNAIECALKRGLLEKYSVNHSMINAYLDKKSEIPLWIVEASCNINLDDIMVPAQYQYLWFCLHNTILKRRQPSGREFRIKVNFSSCYLELDKNIENLLHEACKFMKLPLYKFTFLCGYKKAIANNKKTIPLLALLKISQILEINIWNLLSGHHLFSKTNRTGKLVIPTNSVDVDLMVLLIWLRTEGHVELRSTHIEINQKGDIESLKEIKKIIMKKFNLEEKHLIFSIGKRGEDRLIISSSPLKQLLCLKYEFPLGYKSGVLKPMVLEGLFNDDYERIMAAFIQTEGCLSYSYTRNKKKKLPRFEFIVKDGNLAKECLFALRKLGFAPSLSEKQNIFKVGLYNSKQVVDLVNKTKKYFFNQKKIVYLRGVCTSGIGL